MFQSVHKINIHNVSVNKPLYFIQVFTKLDLILNKVGVYKTNTCKHLLCKDSASE